MVWGAQFLDLEVPSRAFGNLRSKGFHTNSGMSDAKPGHICLKTLERAARTTLLAALSWPGRCNVEWFWGSKGLRELIYHGPMVPTTLVMDHGHGASSDKQPQQHSVPTALLGPQNKEISWHLWGFHTKFMGVAANVSTTKMPWTPDTQPFPGLVLSARGQ